MGSRLFLMTVQAVHFHRKAGKGELKLIISAGQQTPRCSRSKCVLSAQQAQPRAEGAAAAAQRGRRLRRAPHPPARPTHPGERKQEGQTLLPLETVCSVRLTAQTKYKAHIKKGGSQNVCVVLHVCVILIKVMRARGLKSQTFVY